MTTTAVPRWLKLAILPVLAAAAFCVDYEIQRRLADFAFASRFDAFSSALAGVGRPTGPFLAACLIAYPLARLYEQDWKLASMGVVLPILLFYFDAYSGRGDPFGLAVMMFTPFLFAIFVPAIAAGANRALGGSRLVVAPTQGSDTSSLATDPIALKLILLPLLVVGMFLIHDFWQPRIIDLGMLPSAPSAKRAGLMSAQVAGPALLALAFAFPIARIYGRQALVAGALVPTLTVLWSARGWLESESGSFVSASYAVEFVSLAVLAPLAAWRAAGRFRDSRLAIRPSPASRVA